MRNPFKRFGTPNPGKESYQYLGSRSSDKLVIVAGIVTFVVIIVVVVRASEPTHEYCSLLEVVAKISLLLFLFLHLQKKIFYIKRQT